jgi:hypothetical protein
MKLRRVGVGFVRFSDFMIFALVHKGQALTASREVGKVKLAADNAAGVSSGSSFLWMREDL